VCGCVCVCIPRRAAPTAGPTRLICEALPSLATAAATALGRRQHGEGLGGGGRRCPGTPTQSGCAGLPRRRARAAGAAAGRHRRAHLPHDARPRPLTGRGVHVRQAFPSWKQSILTEIYLCGTCSCQEILRVETPGQGRRGGAHPAAAAARPRRHLLQPRPRRRQGLPAPRRELPRARAPGGCANLSKSQST
jgi:hypothetical protein